MIKIEKWNYGNYSNGNYGVNTIAIDINDVTFYFSYDTVVAFYDPSKRETVVSHNVWSITTGKHLNWIQPDRDKRYPHSDFIDALNELLGRMNITLE